MVTDIVRSVIEHVLEHFDTAVGIVPGRTGIDCCLQVRQGAFSDGSQDGDDLVYIGWSKGEIEFVGQNGIQVDYFYPSADNVARETLEKMTPQASGIVPEITMDVPQLKQRDRLALRFTGLIQIPRSGRYTFFTASDDGSRLYIGDELVVNNDGLHGMSEKRGRIELTAGVHPILVTYFDNGGGDGLRVSWSGPRFRKQAIPPESLLVSGGETLHDLAIRAMSSIPGHEAEKIASLSTLIAAGRSRPAAIRARAPER